MNAGDYYELLGVDSDATDEEIRAAFLTRIKKWHPDLNPVGSGDEARLLIEAKAILTNPIERRTYDAKRKNGPLTKSPRTEIPRWIIVCAQGFGDFINISDAIDAAREGDKIYVMPGVYRESLIRIERGIEVVGQPTPEEDVIIEPQEDGIYLSGYGSVLRGISIQNSVAGTFGVVAACHSGTVSSCRFKSPDGTGIAIAEGVLVIEGCTFENCRHGVRVERSHVAILGNRFIENVNCLLARPGADCTLQNNDFELTKAAAIEAQSDATISITRNRFRAGTAGIALSSSTRGLIDQNRFANITADRAILFLDGSAEVAITNNDYE
jgi:hypothetical protein